MKTISRRALYAVVASAGAGWSGDAVTVALATIPVVAASLIGIGLHDRFVGRSLPAPLLAVQAGRVALCVGWLVAGSRIAGDPDAFVRAGLWACVVMMVAEVAELVTGRNESTGEGGT